MSKRVRSATVQKIARQGRLTPTYLILMGTSGVLAAVAFLANSVPLLVGSMIVSPMFPPLALTTFALVGGQWRLAANGFVAAVAGIAVAVVCSMATAWLLNVTGVFPAKSNLIDKPLLEERVSVGWFSAVAALAAGVAGAIAMAKEKFDTLVGVVAALALVPAAAASGIALLSGDFRNALGGSLLLAVNVGVTIGAGMITLFIVEPDETD